MNLSRHIQNIKSVASASAEVLNRMSGDNTNVDRELLKILNEVVLDAKEEYRAEIISGISEAFQPYYRGLIEKAVPKPEMPAMPRMRPMGTTQI